MAFFDAEVEESKSSPTKPVENLKDLGGAALSLGSFSKILAPGLRLGWVHARPAAIETLTAGNAVVQSGGGANPLSQAAVANLIRTGWLDK